MNRRSIMGLMGAGLLLAGCNSTYTYHQKLTVVVQTPEGERTGAAVTEVEASVGSQGLLSQANVSYKVRGEATVVGLGQGKYLFALLSSGGEWTATEYWAMHAFYKRVMDEYPSGSTERLNTFYTALLKMRDSERVAPDQYPLLVTFRDNNDPKSAVQVKPGQLADVFGQGYALKSVSLEITDEPLLKGSIDQLLPWAFGLAGSVGKGMKLPYTHLLNQINDGSFHRE